MGQLYFLWTLFSLTDFLAGFLTTLLNLLQAMTSEMIIVMVRMSESSSSTSKMIVLSWQKRCKLSCMETLHRGYCTWSLSAACSRVSLLAVRSRVRVDITSLWSQSSSSSGLSTSSWNLFSVTFPAVVLYPLIDLALMIVS